MTGYVKLYRDVVMKDIYIQNPLYLRVFERLILEANHCCKRIPYGKGTKLIKRGERLTSIRQIAEWVGWYERGIFKIPNPKTVSEILDWLIKKEMIQIFNKGNSQETHYNVLNYCIYQSAENDESNAKVTVNGEVSKQQTDTNNNDKECIRSKKPSSADKSPAPSRAVSDYFCEVHLKVLGEKYMFQGGKDGTALSNMLKNYDVGFIKDLIDWYFETDDKFIAQTGRDICKMKTQIPKFIQWKNSGPKYSDTRVV
jgi:hypothetical protein